MFSELSPLGAGAALAAAFTAGCIDAIAGGGGLVTTPTLLLLLPEVTISGVLATTKCVSLAGTAAAATAYSRKVNSPSRLLLPAVTAALPAAWLGARSVTALDARMIRPAILIVLIAMAAYTWLRPDLGAIRGAGLPAKWRIPAAWALGAALGFYDGMLGPGTGSLLVLLIVAVFGCEFLEASALAKWINGASNLGALLWFAPAGSVLWGLALPMAAANLAGGLAGSRLAMRGGNRWIRKVFLAVATVLIGRLAWGLFFS